MEKLKEFLEAWIDPTQRDISELREIYASYLGKDLKDCPKCESKAITELNKLLYKMESEKPVDTTKKYILKPGNHRFIQGDTVHNNDNITDELAEFYIKNHPHTKDLFEKMP